MQDVNNRENCRVEEVGGKRYKEILCVIYSIFCKPETAPKTILLIFFLIFYLLIYFFIYL